ncbi:MFS transporter [Methanocella arvoryzae]|uniref:Permease (Major facilitator superfamily) n=1 Tax=Methanocella arvoryzae (strain DSM 22066 / NBRC 105507 / MRE50) TaxID=351160 RepID=Q0W0M4_METAR|nr:MFS transporter [Methanocella arvoryzae]CAJ38069.1 putative permease (major facilitator superfamily) [Methanocella arvoryzae MRE50]
MELKPLQLLVLTSAVFIFTFGFGIIIPIIPYYTRSVNATAFDLGLLLATFSFLQFFCGPIWGKISDHIGRKPVIIFSLLGFTLAFAMVGLSSQLWMIFIAVSIGGFFSAGIFPAVLAFVADITQPSERAKLMGLMGAVSGLGLILGPFASSLLAVYGLSAPFFAAALISFITMIGCMVLIPESITYTQIVKIRDAVKPLSMLNMIIETFRHMFTALKTGLGVFLMAMLVISFAISGFEGTFTYFLMDKIGLSSVTSFVKVFDSGIHLTGPEAMGIVFAMMGAVSVICQGLIVAKAIEMFGEEKVIIFGLLIASVGMILLLTSTDLGTALIYICIISVGSGLVFPCLNTVVSRRTDERNQGVAMGILSSYGSFGRVLGPIVGGYVYVINIAFPYALSAIVMALSAAGLFAYMLMGLWKKKNSEALDQEILVNVNN